MTIIENFGNSAASKGYRAFGSVLTAMVTPFDRHGGLDEFGAEKLAAWLTQDGWNDGVVVNGTTGESVTTSDREKIVMIESAKRALERRGKKVIAGVGAGDTRHSVAMAEAAAAHGADGLLVVAPYYSRPTQDGILQHFRAIADSTPLPVMLYDHPGRTGVALEPDTLAAAAEHPRIIAVKDAKGDLEASSWVMRRTYLSYYSGDDALNLPLLSIGAVGMVSVVGHLVGDRLRSLLDHYSNGRIGEALALHRELLPVCSGMFRAPAAASVKAALKSLGLPAGPVRSPLVDLDEHETQALLADMTSTGVLAPLPA